MKPISVSFIFDGVKSPKIFKSPCKIELPETVRSPNKEEEPPVFKFPPICIFSPIPTPPVIFNAPVLVFVDDDVLVIFVIADNSFIIGVATSPGRLHCNVPLCLISPPVRTN